MEKKKKSLFFAIIGLLTIVASIVFRNTLDAFFAVVLVIGIIITLAGLYDSLNGFTKKEDNKPKYKRKGMLLSRCEYGFYQTLKGMIDEDKFEVLPQIALNCVIDKITHNSYRNELFRIVDFCIIDKNTTAPLLLIELNDSSHLRADRIERDKKVNDIAQRAGMPLVTFKTNEINNIPEIRKIIHKNMLKK